MQNVTVPLFQRVRQWISHLLRDPEMEEGTAQRAFMKIAVINQKGGVGKTTTSVNLAAGLANAGHPVLLVDLDPQAHATVGVGVDPDELTGGTLADVLQDEERSVSEVVVETQVPNLKLAPSSLEMARLDSQLLAQEFREQRLHYALENMTEFSYIIIDCQPTLGVLPVNAIFTAERFLIPVQGSGYALRGLGDLLNTLHRIKRKHEWDYRILLTMVSGQARVTNQRVRETLEGIQNKMFQTIIRKDEQLNRSQSEDQPVDIFRYFKRSKGAADYNELVTELTTLWKS